MAAGAGAHGHGAGTARACADRRGARRLARRARQARRAAGKARTRGNARQARQDAAGAGHAWRTAWARGLGVPKRLVNWLGQFGAHAASLGFDLGF